MYSADLLIEVEQIATIGSSMPTPSGCQVIEVAGKFLLLGSADPHTHFDLPMFGTVFSDNHYTCHKAAAFGGATTVLDFVPQEGPSLAAVVSAWR